MAFTRNYFSEQPVDGLSVRWRSTRFDGEAEAVHLPNDRFDRSYRDERRRLHAARVPLAYTIFLSFGAFVTALEFVAYPERRRLMLAAYSTYVVICVFAVYRVRRWPARTTLVAVFANNALLLCTAGYYIPARATPEACAMTMVLFLAALPLLNGAGAAVQALSCLGALIGYALVLVAGAEPKLPVSYGLTAICGATGVTVLGAYLLDRQRWVAFRGRELLRASEERLRGVSERYRALYEDNPDMYFTVGADHIVRSVNRFGAEQLGYDVDALTGRPLLSVVVAADRECVERELALCMEHLGQVTHVEFRAVRKDASIVWVKASARALRDSDGQMVVLIVCEDTTARKQAEEDARRHQAELAHVGRVSLMGEMAAGLAHELNQPLAAIVNFTRGCQRRLRASGAGDPEMLHALEQVSAQALRAAQIIRRIRDFIRKDEPSLTWVDVNELVRNVAELADPDCRQQGVRIDLALSSSVPKVYADSIQIEQVILNLMRNGLDAMDGQPEAKTLSIHTTALDDHGVDVTVADTGTGLCLEVADRIFDPFFSTKPSGLGLGLSISRSIIEAHGGRLWAEPNPAGGSRFHFRLSADTPSGSAG